MSNAWLLAVGMLFAPATTSSGGSILEPGLWHGSEVTARAGERWLGLTRAGTQSRWRSFLLNVEAAHDGIVDQPGEKTGKLVSVSGAQPLFLVRGMAALEKVSQVTTAFYEEEERRFADGEPFDLRLGGRRYVIRLIDPQLTETRTGKPSSLEISDGSRTQVLYDWPDGFLDQMCSLRWAGDLDGDGRLDLYMSLSNHYNVTEHTLLLSSHAKDGQVVGVAAVWRTTGC